MILTILVFVVILSVLVLIHELGHFLVAKRLGIKVEEFGFGLPPRAFGKKIGETIYSINWLPIGGFVKLYGEDEAGGGKWKMENGKWKTGDRDRAFFARPIWQRSAIVVSGVVMNFLLSVVIISYLFGVLGVPTAGKDVVITAVVKNSPAYDAGLKKGDIVESINNIKVTNPSQLISITKKHLGEEVALKIKDQKSNIKNIRVMPRRNYPKGEGPMGVAIGQNVITKKYPLYQAPVIAFLETLKISWLIVAGFSTMLFNLISQGIVPKDIAGPVGIAQLTGQFVQFGPAAILSFVSLLSLNLAILNILPIPALDGGRLFFILVELATRRKVSQKFEARAHAVGMAFLLVLIALITLHDVVRVFSGQPLLPKP